MYFSIQFCKGFGMKSHLTFFAVFIVLMMTLIFCMAGAAKVNSETPDLPTGPAIGEQIPEFRLPDQDGITRNITDLLGADGAVLNFYRSALW
jgi:hypothetical protein